MRIFVFLILLSSSFVFADEDPFPSLTVKQKHSYFESGFNNKDKMRSMPILFCKSYISLDECMDRVSYYVAQKHISSHFHKYEDMAVKLMNLSDGKLTKTTAETLVLKKVARQWLKTGDFESSYN